MIFNFGQYQLDIDIEKTRAFYEKAEEITEGCDCQGCRNFVKAVDHLPDEVKMFYSSLGIDMKKSPEVFVCCANSDGSLHYDGFYHICGRIISGENVWIKSSNKSRYLDDQKTYAINKNHKVGFSQECFLVEEGFPTPIVQMEIVANIPFVLNEKNSYL